ncbi:MAG: heme utilization cystosolic carrier protein HutX [Proteobacteria bacterium]|nr:heme utilization cystosolic carrier protein HutX [Pseudomonadota bacterium]
MTGTAASDTLARPPLRERLANNADGILEQIAREYGVSTFEVVEALPAAHRTIFPGSDFERILSALTSWGSVVFIVHTPEIVLECEGPIPPGTSGRGYFNLHGDSPIGGHIKAENCTSIAFVMRPFMGRESRSIQFFNAAGEAMFKIFVRRDEKREMIAEQVKLFDELRGRLAG